MVAVHEDRKRRLACKRGKPEVKVSSEFPNIRSKCSVVRSIDSYPRVALAVSPQLLHQGSEVPDWRGRERTGDRELSPVRIKQEWR